MKDSSNIASSTTEFKTISSSLNDIELLEALSKKATLFNQLDRRHNKLPVKIKLGNNFFIKKSKNYFLISLDRKECLQNSLQENYWMIRQCFALIETSRFDSKIQWLGFGFYGIVGAILSVLIESSELYYDHFLIIVGLFFMMTIIQNSISRNKVYEADIQATCDVYVSHALNYLYKKHNEDKNIFYWSYPSSHFIMTLFSPNPSFADRAENIQKKHVKGFCKRFS